MMMSVVIGTHGRPVALGHCLEALAAQSMPPGDYEVIVIDDGSPQPLDAVVAAVRDRMDVSLVVRRRGGIAAARNAGAALARGRWLAFTDDDCRPHPDWLQHLSSALREHPCDLIGGQTLNGLPDNVFSDASHRVQDYLYQSSASQSPFFASCNVAVPTQAFLQVGGFDERFKTAGEDREFCLRWQLSGRSLWRAPDAIVRHEHALTPWTFWRQHWNYGRGGWDFHRLRAQRLDVPLRLERGSFYWNLLRQGRPGLVALSQAATAGGFLAEACGLGSADRSRRQSALMHLCLAAASTTATIATVRLCMLFGAFLTHRSR